MSAMIAEISDRINVLLFVLSGLSRVFRLRILGLFLSICNPRSIED